MKRIRVQKEEEEKEIKEFIVDETQNNNKPYVLIVMPTFNRSNYLQKSINYIKKQTYKNFCFLIIDDGSNLEHKKIFNQLKEQYKSVNKIVFMENELNCHVAKTLNKGIQYLLDNEKYKYLTWISDDNVYYPSFLSSLIKDNKYFKYTSYDIQELDGKICTNNKSYKDFDHILNNFNGCASFMWTKDAIKEIGVYNENVPGCEDFEYLLRTFKINDKECNFSEISTMKFVRHNDSLMEKKREEIMNMKQKIINNYKKSVSIVMAYYNRKPQTLETLRGFERTYAGKYNFEVIIVDDNSNEENRLDEDIKQFNFPINLIIISTEEKGGRINSCIPYNKGFKKARGDIIIIQNPECLHIGNLLDYIIYNFEYDMYLSFPCYNSNNYRVNNFIKDNISNISINNIEELTKNFNEDDIYGKFPIWYQHPKLWDKNLHFCTAIYKEYLDIVGGFDENFKNGVCYEDDAFIFDIKEKLKLNIKSISLDECVGVVHLYHGRSAGCNIKPSENAKQNSTYDKFILNESLFKHKQKINKYFSSPKIIHYYWDDFKKLSYLNLYSLRSSVYYNPDFIHVIWVPTNPQSNMTWTEFCNKDFNQDIHWKNYLDEIKIMKNVRIINKDIAIFLNVDNKMSEIHKSDLFRYKILNVYGGIWCDLDVIFIKSITDIINFKFDTLNFLCINDIYYFLPIGLLISKRNSSLFKLIFENAFKNYDKNRYQCMGAECFKKIFLNDSNNFENLVSTNKFRYLNNNLLTFNNNDNDINVMLDNKFYMSFLWFEIDELFIENKKNKDLSKTVGFHWFNGSDITKEYLKEMVYNIPKKFNGVIFKEKNKFDFKKQNFIFFNVTDVSVIYNWGYFLSTYINQYVNIIKNKFKHTEIKQIQVDDYFLPDSNLINELSNHINSFIVFNELSYSHLLFHYHYGDQKIKDNIIKFLLSSSYICFFSEVIINDSLQTIGNCLNDLKFSVTFFKNAHKIILCNTRNISYLLKNDIHDNIMYFPSIGYSIINNNMPLIKSNLQDIDILFYGNISDSFQHRIDTIEKISDFSKLNNYKFKSNTELHDDEKIQMLIKTKIVIHIPSHKNLHSFPWAKVSQLMCYKVFFIIEENEEMYIKNLDKIVVYYKRNNIDDLKEKITYYLNNEKERIYVTENCFEYIKNNYNMDLCFDGFF